MEQSMLSNLVGLKSWRAKAPALVASLFLLSACGGDDEAPSYPRQANVEYSVTSSTLTKATILYTNETGGDNYETAVALPFTKTLTATVNQNDHLGLSATSTESGTINLVIKVDGQQVEAKSYTGDLVNGTIVYLFQ
jgi:hypothetical protein